MPPPHDTQDHARRQRAAARCDLLLATVQELLGDLGRDGVPVPAGLEDAAGALAQAARALHERAGEAPGYADALMGAIKEEGRRAGLGLAERAEREAGHLLELVTSAQVLGWSLPWGVEQAARSLADWARRQRAGA